MSNDATARELARTVFDRPLVVEAGAGTGKTTTLIARICTWCVGPGWDRAMSKGGDDSTIAARTLDGVVAITFTEAAAAEMAGRFGAALVEIAAGRPVVGLPDLPVSAAEGQRRARALLGSVDRLVLSTIHAFCARVLASAPSEAGLHPAHQVDADGTLLAEVVHEVVVDWFTQVFAGDADGNAALMECRDALVLLARRGIGSDAVVDALTRIAAEAVPVEAVGAEVYTPAAIEDLMHRVEQVLSVWINRVQRRLDGVTIVAEGAVALVAAMKAVRAATRGPRTRAGLAALCAAAEQVDRDRLRDYAKGKFQAGEGRLFGPDRDAIAEASRPVGRAVDHLLHLDPELLEAGRSVLVPLLGRVQAELRRRGVVSFSQLLRGARDLLRRDARVRARLRNGLTQLLVDEFQDTDDLQCELVRMLALEGEGRPGLFLVGDPKQSIYGWRSADLVAYQTFVDEVVRGGGRVLRLDVNRRSLPPILDEVERVMAPIMAFESGYQAEFQPLHSARVGQPPPPRPWGPVEHWVSWTHDGSGGRAPQRADEVTQLEARALAADLLRLRRDTHISWDKIGILFRSTGDQERYLSALRDVGIPYVVERNRQYFRRREIIDAAALIRCILEPEDTLALLTVLRSPLVGAPDAALLPLWRERLPERIAALHTEDPILLAEVRTIGAVAAREAAASGAPGVDRVAGWEHLLVEAAAAIGALRGAYESLPADRFVAVLRDRLPLETLAAGRYLGEYRLANLQRFYGELVNALAAGDPQTVLRMLRTGIAGRREAEEARPSDAAERAVRVLTIHKAKGLDFDHVYLVQLHKGRREPGAISAEDATTTIKEWRGGWQYRLFGARTPGYDGVVEHDARIEANERVRLLYVAMTRARDRLVLLGNWEPEPEVVPVAVAKNLLELMNSRPGLPSFAEVARTGALEASGALWRLADPSAVSVAVTRELPPAMPAFTADEELARRDAAARRMARPVNAAASAAAHVEMVAPAAPSGGGGGGEVATAVGTAVHKAIELMDPAADPARALRSALQTVETVLATSLSAADRPAGRARAERLLTTFVNGALGTRFRALAGCIVLREVATLSAPDGSDDGPVGFVAGAIDLLYQDPKTREVVVVDYKTDAVRTEEERDARAAAYALQLAVYLRVVQAALGLARPPRAELWFLARDEVVVV